MASIWKHPNSPYWTACYTDESGKQRKRSTKETDARKARKAAEAYEEAAVKARRAELTRATAAKIINELMERSHGEGLDTRSIREFFGDYKSGLKARGTKEATLKRYQPIFDGFLKHIGEARTKARLASVSSQEVEAFRNAQLEAGKTPATADFALRVLNGVFEDARRKAIILHNPAQAVKPVALTTGEERRPFTDQQVAELLAAADFEWQGMILFAYHTGIRLNDAANLTMANIDGNSLRFKESKTAHRKRRVSERETIVVLAEDLRRYVEKIKEARKKDAPIFPSLFGRKSGSGGGLSNAFSRLMKRAGIDPNQGEAKTGKGRQFNALSFHSLRHTMISRLANSDTPEAVTKAMSGHSTDEAHRRYVHLHTEAQAKVVAKSPRLWKVDATLASGNGSRNSRSGRRGTDRARQRADEPALHSRRHGSAKAGG